MKPVTSAPIVLDENHALGARYGVENKWVWPFVMKIYFREME